MMKYKNFINEQFKKMPKKLQRKDLEVGMMVKTIGQWDNLDINSQLGKIIEMKEYGYLLIEFINSFSSKLHAGHKNIGKDKHCFYVNLDNIYEIIPEDISDKIIKKQIIPYKASSDLLRIFRRMKFEPTQEYLNSSFFDVDKDNMDLITYLPANKFTGDPDVKKGRQSMKVGRALKLLRPELTEVQLQSAGDDYRAAFKIIVLGEGKNLEVVTGKDIAYWYSNEHYARPSRGELWSSCMSSPSCGRYFTLYVENPDKVALAIYTNEDDKLLARALIWRLDDGRVYMDRIYAVSEADKKVVKDFAKQNGMIQRDQGGHGRMEVTMPKDYGGKDRPKEGNPYLDTMRNFNVRRDGSYYMSNMGPLPGERHGYA